ncbi:MAG TPA: hypothetical protein VFZ23_12215 [Pyrinomonadaceae bacterium]
MFLAIKRFSNVKNPDIVTNKIENELVPKLRDFPGFIAYYAVKFDNGDYGSVGIFETKENIDNALQQTQDWPKKNLPDNFPNDPELIRGEVLFSAAGKTIARSA